MRCTQVYKARRKYTGRVVAIKYINKVGKQEKELVALRQELNIMQKLQHPNIIEMIEAKETKSDFCVVMEYAFGERQQTSGVAGCRDNPYCNMLNYV